MNASSTAGIRTRTVIAISGEPAAGKTTAAALVAEMLSGVSIDTDLLCSPLRAAALECLGLTLADIDGPLYEQQLRPAVYQGLVDTAVHLAQFSHPVIVSGPFHPSGFSEGDWAGFRGRLKNSGATLQRIHLVAGSEIVRGRMVERGEPRDAGKFRDWSTYQEKWSGWDPAEAAIVVNDGSVAELGLRLADVLA